MKNRWNKRWCTGLGAVLATVIAATAWTHAAQLDYEKRSDWGSGFVANLTITNTDSQPINGWQLEFDLPVQITNIWNARIVSQTGGRLVLENLGYNATIPAGASTSFGFQATPGGSSIEPTNVVLNGIAIGEDGGGTPPTLPTLSATNTSINEGDSGTGIVSVAVTLSTASTQAVSANYTTQNATASAGTDYTSTSGTVSIPAGTLTGSIPVTVVGNTAVEEDETFQVVLSNPVNATLADAVAVVTILNDDTITPPVVPALSIGDVVVEEPADADPGTPGTPASGFFSTSGNQIVDENGTPVRIAGVNWFGMESSNFAPHGIWTRGYKDMMDQIKELGFNTIRLPFASQAFDPGTTTSGIDFFANPDLPGLSPIEVMDKVVEYAGQIGLRIILDHHRSNAGPGPNSNGLWYTSTYPESRWISDWEMLAERYAGNPTIVGADLSNEPHNGVWGGGGVNDWPAAAERAASAIHAQNSDWLIFVEGVGQYQGASYWWGGALAGVRDRPVQLTVPNKLVYSPHAYPNSIFSQTWFSDASFPQNLFAVWQQNWGFIYEEGIAPIMLGEFGSRFVDPKDVQWMDKMYEYLQGDLDGNGTNDVPAGQYGISWTWWSLNPNSSDTGGILQDDWRTVHQFKVDNLAPSMFDFGGGTTSGGGGTGTTLASFPVTLSEVTTATVSVDYATDADTASVGEDFVATSGTVTFAPGETTKNVDVTVLADTIAEGDEAFFVDLGNAVNATIELGDGMALIPANDGGTGGGGHPGGGGDDTPPGGDDEPLVLTVSDDWGSGFVAELVLTNTTSTTYNGWTAEFTLPVSITNIWNAEIVSQNGNRYVIRNASWNANVPASGTVSFGFQGTPDNPGQPENVVITGG